MDLKMILLAVITLIVLYAVYVMLVRSNQKKRLAAVIKKMQENPHREMRIEGVTYLVAFVENENYYKENQMKYPIPLEVKKKMREGWETDWGVFCETDITTIETYIKFNPGLRVLNIPCGNYDGLMCHPMYKIIRLK